MTGERGASSGGNKHRYRSQKPQSKPPLPQPEVSFDPDAFCARVRGLARPLWRDLPWRRTRDAYRVWLSEVMLQQTQVVRVEARWDGWLERFPTVRALAESDPADVLEAWQGMGYNRRALALHRAAVEVVETYGGSFPRSYDELTALPGVGPATAAGIRAFAFDESGVYLETNVRAVFIHELFPHVQSVPDAALVPLVRACCPASGKDVRGWYYALLDYGAWLKKQVANPTRRSSGYARQSRFEGSRRQKRAQLVRVLLSARQMGAALAPQQVCALFNQSEVEKGRPPVPDALVFELLDELAREGFCTLTPYGWVAGETG